MTNDEIKEELEKNKKNDYCKWNRVWRKKSIKRK